MPNDTSSRPQSWPGPQPRLLALPSTTLPFETAVQRRHNTCARRAATRKCLRLPRGSQAFSRCCGLLRGFWPSSWTSRPRPAIYGANPVARRAWVVSFPCPCRREEDDVSAGAAPALCRRHRRSADAALAPNPHLLLAVPDHYRHHLSSEAVVPGHYRRHRHQSAAVALDHCCRRHRHPSAPEPVDAAPGRPLASRLLPLTPREVRARVRPTPHLEPEHHVPETAETASPDIPASGGYSSAFSAAVWRLPWPVLV